ncbi:MAG: Na+/H+ antiporter subunit E [Actinomycetes bacterium]
MRTRAQRLQPVPLLWLTAAWVLLWGNLSWANVLAGLVLGAVVLLVFPLPKLAVGVQVRPLALLRLVVRFLFDVVVASVHVAWLAVRPAGAPRSSVITIPLVTRNELFQTIVGEMVSLVPGSLVIDLDGDSGLLHLHYLEVETREDLERVRASVLDLEQRVLAALAADRTGRSPAGDDS